MKHENTGRCLQCLAIINRYEGFNQTLKDWFIALQEKHPEVHTSCAGRGIVDQENLFLRGATRARWMQSAHNYNAALDLFVVIKGEKSIYPPWWFKDVLAKNIPQWMEWYGAPGAKFPELPHVQMKDWKVLLTRGDIKLIIDVKMMA